jgi:hypothetical protein
MEKSTNDKQVNVIVKTDEEKKKVFGKYYIDLKHFKNNILTVKYLKSTNVVPNFKSIIMNSSIKPIINEMMDLKYIDKIKYEKLSGDEKRLINNLAKFMNIKNDLKKSTDDEFQKQYEILLGEVVAGNDSPIIKTQLRKYILQAINEGLLTRNCGYNLLVELKL